jgi:Nitronate monooxygenase
MQAGGHVKSTTAHFTLLPAVVEAVSPVPVIAAGGIADGRGLVAALSLSGQVENPEIPGPGHGSPAGPLGLHGSRAPCHPQEIRLDTDCATSAGPQVLFPR